MMQVQINCYDSIVYHFARVTKIELDEKDSLTIFFHRFKVKKFKTSEYYDYKVKED